MKEFRFRVGLKKGCRGLNLSLEQWLETDPQPETAGVAIVVLKAPSWGRFFEGQPRVVCCCRDILYEFFLEWLECQYDCQGIKLDNMRFTPRQFLEVSPRWELGMVYDGPEPKFDPDTYVDEWDDEDFDDDEDETHE